MEIAGAFSPPFRPLSPEEDNYIVEMINRSKPDVLWVGLGCPKQEYWVIEHRERLNVPVILAVGQAFDIHAGTLKRAPRWMREHGLEWLFRLMSEPRRLWRRYLISNSQFVFYVALDAVRVAGRPR
jgi:N-acetylglucosaminyldiphosphoundecaprenol N-acetyl-beta-D-mannosaminyltransferase